MMEQWLHHDRLKLWLLSEAQRARWGRERLEPGPLVQAEEAWAPSASFGRKPDGRSAQRKSRPHWGYFTP